MSNIIKHELFFIRDQGHNQTCVSICITSIIEYIIRKVNKGKIQLDERYIHYNVHNKIYKTCSSCWNKPIEKIKDAITIAIKFGCLQAFILPKK